MVLDYRNRDIGPHEARFELNLPKVEAHAKILHQHCHITPRPWSSADVIYSGPPKWKFLQLHLAFQNYAAGTVMLCYRQSTIFSTHDLQSEKCHHNFYYPWNFPQIPEHNFVAKSMLLASITSLAKSIKGSGLQRSNTYLIPKGLLPHPNLCLSTGKMMVFFWYANDISRARINEKLAFFYRRVISY